MTNAQVFRLVFVVWMALQRLLRGTNAQGLEDTSKNGQSVSESPFIFFHQSEYPRDCQEVQDQCPSITTSGVYVIKPDGYPNPFEIHCDNSVDSGGWTVIQRRQCNGTVAFSRDWESFKLGFGFLSHEFWIGNEILSYLTNQKQYYLLIEVTTLDGSTFIQSNSNFRMSDGFSSFKLLSLVHQPGPTDPITWCPSNMIYGNCTCGQRHCGNLTTCEDTCDRDLTEGCACPEGYYMQDGDCVPEDQCRCYVEAEQTIVPENATYVNHACTRLAVCADGELFEYNEYQCSSDAVCEERDGVRRCHCNVGYAGDGENCTSSVMGIDCQAVYDAGHTDDGVYMIRPTDWSGTPFDVYCNMTADGEGWTVFQRRMDGSVDFYLYWDDYREGFGSVDHEHWLGNEKLYYLTNQRNYELRIDMVYKDGNPYYAEFDLFKINDESDNYRLSGLGSYSGDSGHASLNHDLNRQFTTRDWDNDDCNGNCATTFQGAWWFANGGDAKLNGIYSTTDCSYSSVTWVDDWCTHCNLKYSEMKIRPV